MALDAQILLSILSHESSAGDISRTLRVTPASYSLVLSNGTGANQAQVAWSDAVTQPTANYDINLAALTDDRGTVEFTAIKVIYIANTSASNALTAFAYAEADGSPSPANAWTGGPFNTQNQYDSGAVSIDPAYILPGGMVAYSAPTAGGYPVTSGSTVIRFSAAIGTTYEILLIGEGTIS